MSDVPRPYTLVAELTYACPLRCAYCSNPTQTSSSGRLLDSAAWCEVLRQAEALGVVQVHLSGGEPLLRPDLETIVASASDLELHVQLVTSGVPLRRERLSALARAGLSSLQVSFQDVDGAAARKIAGADHGERKRRVAAWAVELGLPLTVNVVLHRENIERTAELVRLAEELGAQRLELANAQYLGWALRNRAALLPTRSQIDAAREVARQAQERLRGRMEVLFVLPDYFAGRPRACMDGWARRYVIVAPDGSVMPCHAAASIDGLRFERVPERPLGEVWRSSPALHAFRGESWMAEPCRSCERRSLDHGGCRCQAFALTGDAAATDPACALSPHHEKLHQQPYSGLITLRRGAAGQSPE